MAKRDKEMISDELLAAYLEGNTTEEETLRVLRALEGDELLQELMVTAERVDAALGEGGRSYSLIPMTRMAAESEGNLCDVQCEEYVLRRRGIPADAEALEQAARDNRWLRGQGTPLHSVGRLLERSGLSVVRSYEASEEMLRQALDAGDDAIVVVNSRKLAASQAECSESDPNHAVVVVAYDRVAQRVSLYDPASDDGTDSYPAGRFLEAWDDSCRYLVRVAEKGGAYNPQPIDTGDIELTEDLLELREAIAENAHDVWAAARIREGWSYGPVRDDARKRHPDLVPYADLPDGEKEYDRRMAFDTIKLVKKLGFDMVKHSDSELYRLMMGRLHRRERVSHCPHCGAPVLMGQAYCGDCGRKVEWKEWM